MNIIKLYHYSQIDIKDKKLKVKYFAINSYSKASQKLSNIKRLYFYLNPKKREYYFNNSNFLYIVRINKNVLYDLNKDLLQVQDKNIIDIYKYLKKKKYKGVIGYNQVHLFNDISIFKKINLTSN